MDTVLTMMLLFWAGLFAAYLLIQRGLWIFTDVAKSMSLFMLEKALGPGADLVEGRAGSGAKAWIIQGTIWLLAAATFTFEGLWLTHDPNALHSLSSWGYSPSAASLISAGEYTALYGSISMFIIGAGLHIIPKLVGTKLASEKNGVLSSFLWTFSVLFLIIGAHAPIILTIPVLMIGTIVQILALTSVIVNQLLTISARTATIALPAWMLVFGLLGEPIATTLSILTGAATTGIGQWMTYHLIGGSFFFLGTSGIALYAASASTGNALWSKILAGVTLVGGLMTINPLGATDGSMVADMLGPLADSATIELGATDGVAVAFLMALSFLPMIAFAGNMMITMRGNGASVEGAGSMEMNLGTWLVIPITIGALFVQTDVVAGTGELAGLSNALSLMAVWLVLVPLTLGASLSLYPAITGRNLLSQNRARWGFWMLAGGALFGISITMIADFIDMALVSATVEDPVSLVEELRKVGSVMFYGVVIGAVIHSLNMISGLFRGVLVETIAANSSSIKSDSYSLTSATSVRRILASGAGLDTEVVPVSQSDEKGNATKL
jgi:hypothetical protein